MSSMYMRSGVFAFADAMEAKLQRHDGDRGPRGWANDTPGSLAERVHDEYLELNDAVLRQQWKRAAEEAVDVANFAMMVRERCLEMAAERQEPAHGS